MAPSARRGRTPAVAPLAPVNARQEGFTLLELTIALGLGATLLAGMLLVAESSTLSLRQQASLTELQERAGFALGTLSEAVESAGYSPVPWTTPTRDAAVDGSAAIEAPGGDRLTVRRWSRRNCLGNDNPVRGADGEPAPWFRVSAYEVRPARGLVTTCHYGPGPGAGVRQLNAATLVEGVEALVLRVGEDRDGDGRVDAWLPAGGWTDERRVIGLRIGMLIAGPAAQAPAARPLRLLGRTLTPPADGRPRRAMTTTVPIRGRL